jgi:ribosomal protein L31
MRENIHPDYHTITVTLPSGTVYETRSTYGEAGSNISISTHQPIRHGQVQPKPSRAAAV